MIVSENVLDRVSKKVVTEKSRKTLHNSRLDKIEEAETAQS